MKINREQVKKIFDMTKKQFMCMKIGHEKIVATHHELNNVNGEHLCCRCYHWTVPTSGITNRWTDKDWEDYKKAIVKKYNSCPLNKEKYETN